MDEEKITLPASKMRARNVDFQSNAGYPLSNKRAKRSYQEKKDQDWLGEKSYGSTSSSPKKPVLGGLLEVSKRPGSSKGAAVGTMDSELLLSMRTGAKRTSPAPDADDEDDVDAPTSPATPVRGSKADRTVTTPGNMGEEAVKSSSFPERLMELFEGDVAKDAMWWLPGGDAFALSPDLFPDQVLQKYFQGTKFESFTRKLNRWGFKRLAGQRVPTNCVAYYHNLFQKGKPELLKDMRSGKKKDADLQDALLQLQLRRDLEAVGLANAYGSHSSLGNLPATQNPRSPPLSSRSHPHPQAAPSSSYGGLGAGMSGLSGMDNESLLRQLLQQQQQSNPHQHQQSNPLAQELQTQSMLGRNYAADYTADLALQRQVQLLASAEQMMRSQRLQQQQEQEHKRQQQASLVSELQQRLLVGSGFGSVMSGSGGMSSYSDVTPSMLLTASQQGQSSHGQLPSSYGFSSSSNNEMDSRLIRILLQQQQQKQQQQGRR